MEKLIVKLSSQGRENVTDSTVSQLYTMAKSAIDANKPVDIEGWIKVNYVYDNELEYLTDNTNLQIDYTESYIKFAFPGINQSLKNSMPNSATGYRDYFLTHDGITKTFAESITSWQSGWLESVKSTITSFDEFEKFKNVTLLWNGCFEQMRNLVSVKLPPNLVNTGGWTFAGCTSLDHIEFPSTVTSFGRVSLGGCTSLRYCIINSTTPPTLDMGESTSMDNNLSFPIYVPDASLSTYQSDSNWSTYGSRIKSLTQFATDFPNA